MINDNFDDHIIFLQTCVQATAARAQLFFERGRGLEQLCRGAGLVHTVILEYFNIKE